MIKIRFPFDIKYVDQFQEETLIINLNSQGGEVFERQCVDIVFKLAIKENINSILIENPERFDAYLLRNLLKSKRDQLKLSIQIEEKVTYAI